MSRSTSANNETQARRNETQARRSETQAGRNKNQGNPQQKPKQKQRKPNQFLVLARGFSMGYGQHGQRGGLGRRRKPASDRISAGAQPDRSKALGSKVEILIIEQYIIGFCFSSRPFAKINFVGLVGRAKVGAVR
jgi:hypothetical protein